MAIRTKIITVKGVDIALAKIDNRDYISLTNMASAYNAEAKPDMVIQNWLRNKHTIEYIGLWETMNNDNFKPLEFEGFKNRAGSNSFVLTPKQWSEKTDAIGLFSKQGRYGGGTYAHQDIAYHFAMWLSAEFHLLVIKEFQRLKDNQAKQLKSEEWLHRRFLIKANYTIQTDAIKTFLIPNTTLPKGKQGILYASEAELINFAVLGRTAKEWNAANVELVAKGENMRDNLSTIELIVLDNMQTLNAHLLSQNIEQNRRIFLLREESQRQMCSLLKSRTIQNVEQQKEGRGEAETQNLKDI